MIGVRRLSTAALPLAVVVLLAGCGAGQSVQAADCTWKIATLGPFSGEYATLGVPAKHGVELAVEIARAHNVTACHLEVLEKDTLANPEIAEALAHEVVEAPDTVACICPYFSDPTLAAGDVFSQAGMLMTGPGTDVAIAERGFDTWFRAVPSNATQAQGLAFHIETNFEARLVAIVHDGTAYGEGLAEHMMDALDTPTLGPFEVDPATPDFSEVIEQVKERNADAVFYGGYVTEAGELAGKLHAEGLLDVAFFAGDGVKDPFFGKIAGETPGTVLVSCPCVEPIKIPGASSFAHEYESSFGSSPGTFAVNLYDMANIVIDVLDEISPDLPIDEIRQRIVDHFATLESYVGAGSTYTWRSNGELVAEPGEDIWIYEWSREKDVFVPLGSVEDN